ncbi:MAG: hypothetical protein RQ748_11140 [Elusimicrobiales bacterium]|nr:hypothetical protein [Elusimicrobiales bacterium]
MSPPETAASAALLGALCGAFNGLLAGAVMKRAVAASQNVFFAAFVAGFFYRLLFLLGSLWLLRNEKYIIIVAFAAALIAVQLILEVVLVPRGPWTSKRS